MSNGIEIRGYCGDFEDVAEFARRVWTSAYRGKMWFPLWDADFFRWQIGPQSGALSAVAYDKAKLVGCSFAIPHALRMGSSVLPIGLGSWTSIDPDYHHLRIGQRLIEALHQRHAEMGLAFCIGVVSGGPRSPAHRFWAAYARAFPHNACFLFRFGFWAKVLAPDKVKRAGVDAWERLASSAFGPVLRLIPHQRDPDVRPYCAGDLEPCVRILDKASAHCDWALVWSAKRLANHLAGATSRTFVLERNGRVQGMVNCHCLSFQGREPARTALIDLWADDDVTAAQRMRLLGHLCNDLRERDVHLVLALRSAMMPPAAFAANVFLPVPAPMRMIALYVGSGVSLSPPKTWSLVMR
jgi:GNAT superfamily N-acetyltransferase